jgi:hypothetical protein
MKKLRAEPKHTAGDLKAMQAWPPDRKIHITVINYIGVARR